MTSARPVTVEHRRRGLAGPSHRRHVQLVERLAVERLGQPLGLGMPELGERRIDDVAVVADPLRLGVSNQHELHEPNLISRR